MVKSNTTNATKTHTEPKLPLQKGSRKKKITLRGLDKLRDSNEAKLLFLVQERLDGAAKVVEEWAVSNGLDKETSFPTDESVESSALLLGSYLKEHAPELELILTWANEVEDWQLYACLIDNWRVNPTYQWEPMY